MTATESTYTLPFTDAEVTIKGRLITGEMVEVSVPKLIMQPDGFVFKDIREITEVVFPESSKTFKSSDEEVSIRIVIDGKPLRDGEGSAIYTFQVVEEPKEKQS